ANAAGEARLIASSRPIGGADSLARLAKETMRSAAPRTLDELGDDETALAAAMRSAALVPVAVPGQDVRGALIRLHRGRAHFSEVDLARIGPFAESLWVVLRRGPLEPAQATPRHSQKTAS